MIRHFGIQSRPATLERLKGLLRYDPMTGLFWWTQKPKNQTQAGSVAGCPITKDGYIRIKIEGRRYFAHRLAWVYVHGTWPSHEIDHKDRNRSNNAITNLREATRRQNNRNRVTKGYSFNKRDRKFCAQIIVHGRTVSLGRFDTAEEASAAYKRVHTKLAGEFSFTHQVEA